VLRLVRALRAGSPDGQVVIHHDARRTRLDAAAVRALGAHQIEPPTPVAWGEESQLAMHLRGLAWTLRRFDFDWLSFVSGQDYPVRPLGAIEAELAAASCDGFLERALVTPPARSRDAPVDEFAARYFYTWRRLPGRRAWRPAGVRRLVAAARPAVLLRDMPTGPRLGLPARSPPFSAGWSCHRGADWYTLSRRAVEAVVAFVRDRPDVVRYYQRTLIATESFVHTVLHNDESLEVVPATRRFSSWSADRSHPDTLGTTDLERILSSGADFARKFDVTVDRAVLDALDRHLGSG
jgi:hypothetical protein